jgi:peptide/nickel transport system ATP-binding protein
MSTHLLHVDNLTIGFPNAQNALTHVLHDVSLHIERGARIGVVGESGCGKSTLAYAMLGMIRGTGVRVHGTVSYAGAQLFAMTPAELQQLRGAGIALVPQNAGQSLAPHQTVYQQIAEVLEIHHHMAGDAAHHRVVQLLGDMRLHNPALIAQRYPHQLSGGQQQRVALAMALAGEPNLLVLDEPTTGLDVTTQAQLLALLYELTHDTQMAMVLVSHDLGVIAHTCEHVVVMYAGEVVEMGETDRVFRQPYHPYTRGLIAAMPRLHAGGLPFAMSGQMDNSMNRQQCALRARCSFARPDCASAPPLTFVEHTRAVRCHHWQDVAAPHQHTIESPVVITESRSDEVAPILELRHVSATYQRSAWRWWTHVQPHMVVSQVDITVTPGQTCAVVGESGSGKSTLARVITGLHPPTDGGVYLARELLPTTVTNRSHAQRRRMQLVFQNPDLSLNPRHTVAELLYRPQAVFFGRSRTEALPHSIAMLQQLRLDESYLRRLPQQLSGGEKQRVAIARAFLADPDVVVCDEVVSALDVSVQAALLRLLVEIQHLRGTAYIFIAHDLAVVRAIAHTVVVLFAGHVCEQGTTTPIFTNPHHPYTMLLLSAVLTVPRRELHVHTAHARDTTPRAQGGCPFRLRCPIAIPQQCEDVVPPWQHTTAAHSYRCHHPSHVLVQFRNQLLLPTTQEEPNA